MQCKLHNATDSFYIKVKLNLREDLSSGLAYCHPWEIRNKSWWKTDCSIPWNDVKFAELTNSNTSPYSKKLLNYDLSGLLNSINSILVLAISCGQWKGQFYIITWSLKDVMTKYLHFQNFLTVLVMCVFFLQTSRRASTDFTLEVPLS